MESNAVNKTADELSKDKIIVQLMQLLMDNERKREAHQMFEMASCMDMISDRLDGMSRQLLGLQEEISKMRKEQQNKRIKKVLSGMSEKAKKRVGQIRVSVAETKTQIKDKAAEIISEFKVVGRAALNKVSEFFGVRKRLESIKAKVQEGIVDTEHTLSKIDEFGNGMREAGQNMANAFRSIADKPQKDYADKEKRVSKTELLKKPWKWQERVYQSMERYLDYAIESVKQLSAKVQVDEMNKQWADLFDSDYEKSGKPENVQGEEVSAVAEELIEYHADAFEKVAEKQIQTPDSMPQSVVYNNVR